MKNFKKIFKNDKPVIAMVHLPALPGSPLYDPKLGLNYIIESAQRDLEATLMVVAPDVISQPAHLYSRPELIQLCCEEDMASLSVTRRRDTTRKHRPDSRPESHRTQGSNTP